MASTDDHPQHDSPFTGYEPTRPSKLRAAASEPPPLPPLASEDPYGFGSADEDGLRMLAALETLTSLEPDYSDDLAAEASVTIIEATCDEVIAEAMGADRRDWPRRARLVGEDEGGRLLLNGYETFTGLGDEATVEIVHTSVPIEAPEQPVRLRASHPVSLTERLALVTGRGATGGRFFKALSGG